MSVTGEAMRAMGESRNWYARQSQMTVFGTVPSLHDVQQNFSDCLALAVGIYTPASAVEAGRVAVHPGRGHVLPTPGRFAGLENREEVIAKPCAFNGGGVLGVNVVAREAANNEARCPASTQLPRREARNQSLSTK